MVLEEAEVVVVLVVEAEDTLEETLELKKQMVKAEHHTFA